MTSLIGLMTFYKVFVIRTEPLIQRNMEYVTIILFYIPLSWALLNIDTSRTLVELFFWIAYLLISPLSFLMFYDIKKRILQTEDDMRLLIPSILFLFGPALFVSHIDSSFLIFEFPFLVMGVTLFWGRNSQLCFITNAWISVFETINNMTQQGKYMKR